MRGGGGFMTAFDDNFITTLNVKINNISCFVVMTLFFCNCMIIE